MKKYYLGKEFGRAARLSYGITGIICIQGGFIYHYLFPRVPLTAVVVMFFVIAAICLFAEVRLFAMARRDIWYFVSEKGLLVNGLGKTAQLYPYEQITRVFEERFVYDSLCNVRFQCGEKVIRLNRYLDDPCQLALDIIDRLPSSVTVDEEILKKLHALSGMHI